MRFRAVGLVGLVSLLIVSCTGTPVLSRTVNPFAKIQHFIVLYQENWSFDSLYGLFPGAEGLLNAPAASLQQVDKAGEPYSVLPQPLIKGKPDPRFPANLPVKPFDASKYVAPELMTGDLVHRFYQEQYQIDGGKMDKFVAWSDAAGLTMSYYDAANFPEGKLARQYTLADHFFHAAFGGSFLNHLWMACACTPTFEHAPSGMLAKLDANGNMLEDGAVTPDGYLVNTAFTVNTPHPASTKAKELVPSLTLPTIGDSLSDKGISWAWYSGGWNDAVAGHPDPLFQYHHQPYAYFAKYADGTPGRAAHLKDEQDFLHSLKNGSLPSVSFVKPLGEENEHPGYSAVIVGQQHIVDLVQAVQQSQYWKNSAIIITYDENGGRWDHMAPPKIDRWGPGSRVPTIVISPFAKQGVVDHTQYDTTSILRTIEMRWSLPALGSRDAKTYDLRNALPLANG